MDSKISVRDCVSGTVCPGVRRPVGAHGVLVGGGRGVGGLVGGLVGSGTRTWPEAWRGARNDLYEMMKWCRSSSSIRTCRVCRRTYGKAGNLGTMARGAKDRKSGTGEDERGVRVSKHILEVKNDHS